MNTKTRAPHSIQVDPHFTFRTPLLPLSEWSDLGTTVESVRARFRELLKRRDVRDGIFIASPDLYQSLDAWEKNPETASGRKVERSLMRYFTRMAGRCTPFGVFSGISIGQWARATSLPVPPSRTHERRTRLDHDYLSTLCDALRSHPAIVATSTYWPNSSLYSVHERIRYIEEHFQNRIRSHRLVSVESSEAVTLVLGRATSGATRAQLAQVLLAHLDDVEEADALAFIDEMISAQILDNRITPSVTGDDAAAMLIDTLRKSGAAPELANTLQASLTELAAIDADGVGADVARYQAIAERLDALGIKVDIRRLFQVDVGKFASEGTLSPKVSSSIARGLATLREISRPVDNPALANFRRDFTARYGDREVPLVEALDEEAGIGFGASDHPSASGSPLLEGLNLHAKGAPPSAQWSSKEMHLLQLLSKALANGAQEILLTPDDLQAMKSTPSANLPAACAIMTTLIAESASAVEQGDFKLLLESSMGPSGMRALGRFCYLSPKLHDITVSHLRREEALEPDAIFAEVAHLPGGRIGNVLFRPVLREYEIPFLSQSGAAEDKQIPIQDLTIRIAHDRIVLRSTKLDREIIPRMSNAHNFYIDSLGIYRFLCALQNEATGHVRWQWGPFESAPFLPRVTWSNIVFSRATWRVSGAELRPLAEAALGDKAKTPEEIRATLQKRFEVAQELRRNRKLPRFVVFDEAEGLLVDFDNPLSVDSFLHAIREREFVRLFELLPNGNQLVAEGDDGRYLHELIVSMIVPPEAVVKPRLTSIAVPPDFTRRFQPGSEWLFASIFTGWSSIDTILREVIAPLNAEASDLFDEWFFLRYKEQDEHLRIRYRGSPEILWTKFRAKLDAALAPSISKGVVWRMHYETYEREVDRYGGPYGMLACEKLFHADSNAVLQVVEVLEGNAGTDVRARLAIRGTDRLLHELGLDLDAKLHIMQHARAAFFREFGVETATIDALGLKFRTERNALEALLATDGNENHPLSPGFAMLDCRSETLRDVGRQLHALEAEGKLNQSVSHIAGSLVHMHINRMLRSAHRAQELVIYDLLQRHYESLRARRKSS